MGVAKTLDLEACLQSQDSGSIFDRGSIKNARKLKDIYFVFILCGYEEDFNTSNIVI